MDTPIEATPTSPEVADLIERLRRALQATYGTDYAFSVAGRGHTLGASTYKHGVVVAKPQHTPHPKAR